ncbi:MAG: sigma-70 family RNA polymerase sigma factor [Lentilitoribacter sp.]
MANIDHILEESFKADWGPSVAYMLRVCGDISLAEECVQSAFEAAFKAWTENVPDNKGAWIRKSARNRFIDHARATKLHSSAHEMIKQTSNDNDFAYDTSVLDDELSLMFLCCHPAISPKDQVILVLRLIGGLKPYEIGKAFDHHEEAIRSRLLRAKRKMKAAKISTTLPHAEDLSRRVRQVLAAIYLIYNEGYRASRNATHQRADLALEAISLAARFCRYMPKLAEAHGLMALILLGEARRPARFNDGMLIPLEEQDRDLWDRDLIKAGLFHVQNAQNINADNKLDAGIYLLQAVIAAHHSTSIKFSKTNWSEITTCYDQLLKLQSSAMFALNRIAAASYIKDARSCYATLDDWESQNGEKAQSCAIRADIARRDGDINHAQVFYSKAMLLEPDEGVKRFLQSRIDELSS